ncbi:recombination protein NinG [Rosenbergiella epipactidis]|uniref:recombination protein NinG n=1 Tax=Rosenbergiella epipactidis TaxID=1544694 RepID=UPI001BDADB43|nr:recombination protein NinG [Rosenbergiella epipactidis]MBT0716866.1 recombination protein NinG [Rosenbergiella epipactidis]
MRKPRRRCKICREWFNPRFDNEWWCSPEHGAEYGLILREKEKLKKEQQRKKEAQQERRHHQIRKLEVKPLSYFHSKAQAAFNTYIRTRDAEQPCISCGRHHEGKYDAGHYRTRGASPATRYDEANCHKQCVPCNQHLSGNIENYTPNLIEKIGQEAFEVLMGPHPVKKWTREEL